MRRNCFYGRVFEACCVQTNTSHKFQNKGYWTSASLPQKLNQINKTKAQNNQQIKIIIIIKKKNKKKTVLSFYTYLVIVNFMGIFSTSIKNI